MVYLSAFTIPAITKAKAPLPKASVAFLALSNCAAVLADPFKLESIPTLNWAIPLDKFDIGPASKGPIPGRIFNPSAHLSINPVDLFIS